MNEPRPGEQQEVPETDGSIDRARGVQVCLILSAYYAWVVSVIAGLAMALPLVGVPLAPFRLDALYLILISHLIAALILSGLIRAVRRACTLPRLAAPLVISLMPLCAIASCDRLALVLSPPIAPTGGSVLFQTHPTRRWTLRPNASSESLFVELNERGQRGPVVPFEKAPGERRIVIVGDSVAFGYGTTIEKRFDRVMLDRLNEEGVSNFSIVNLSVPGYAPWQEIDVLQHEGSPYDPDLVLYCFCLNDVVDWFWREVPRGGPPPFNNQFWERSGLLRLARTAWHNGKVRRVQREYDPVRYALAPVLHDEDTPGVHEMWTRTLADIRRLIEVARTQDRSAAIVMFPYDVQVRASEEALVRPQRRVAALAHELGVPCLDLLDAFRRSCRERAPDGCRLFTDGWHLTERGHERTAEALLQFLSQTDLGLKALPASD